jgi:hypothetical protein
VDDVQSAKSVKVLNPNPLTGSAPVLGKEISIPGSVPNFDQQVSIPSTGSVPNLDQQVSIPSTGSVPNLNMEVPLPLGSLLVNDVESPEPTDAKSMDRQHEINIAPLLAGLSDIGSPASLGASNISPCSKCDCLSNSTESQFLLYLLWPYIKPI